MRFAPFSLSRLRPVHKFTSPQNLLLEPKNILFGHVFAQKSLVFHRYLMHKATKQYAKLCNLTCIFQNFISHLEPFHPAFCTILPCVLQQFTLRFAAKRKAKCNKTPKLLLQNAYCSASFAFLCNANVVFSHLGFTPFDATKKTSRECNICVRVNSWWVLRAVFAREFTPKILHSPSQIRL